MKVWRSGAAGVMVALVLCACGSDPDATALPVTPLPVTPASAPAESQEASRQAVAAFLDLMADPDLSYRMQGELRAGSEDPRGGPAILITSRYDIRGDDYGGSTRVRLRDLKWAVDRQVLHTAGTTQLMDGQFIDPVWREGPEPPRGPGVLRGLAADDLAFVGVNDEGLLEFQVQRWLEGDPLGDWVEIGVVPEDKLPQSDLVSYDTRLFIDEAGAPHRLITSWTFTVDGSSDPVSGRIVDDFGAFGLYVDLSVKGDFWLLTSHDIIVGVDDDHTSITEPFTETRPDGPEIASLVVVFPDPEQPVMLGIEGAVLFVRSVDADGTVILDRIVRAPESTIEIPAGAQTLVAYYRSCDGNCGLLDPPHDFCSVEADAEPAGSYRLIVEVQERDRAACTVVAAGD
jgi:hypothetical protein